VKRILRAAQLTLLALAALYAGDYVSARFRLPGNRQTLGSVDVQTLWAIRQKDGRIDYELGGTETQTCLRSLFPHLGYTPCWYLTRHKKQLIEVGIRRRFAAAQGGTNDLLFRVSRNTVHFVPTYLETLDSWGGGRLQPSPEGTPGFSPPPSNDVKACSRRTEVRRRLKPAPPKLTGISAK
jgi:hypothetical protein